MPWKRKYSLFSKKRSYGTGFKRRRFSTTPWRKRWSTMKRRTTKQWIPKRAVQNLRTAWALPKVRLGTIVPARCMVKMPYYEEFSVAVGAAAYADYTFSLTSIFDPNTTGTGHQPRGHDQWASFYNYYRVRKVTIVLQAWPNQADNTNDLQQIVGSAVSVFSGGSTNVTDIIESPYSGGFVRNKWKMIQRGSQSLDGNKYTRRVTFDLDRLRPVLYGSASQPEMIDLIGQMGSNPAAYNQYFTIWSGSANSIENVPVPCAIKLMYHVELMDPAIITQS